MGPVRMGTCWAKDIRTHLVHEVKPPICRILCVLKLMLAFIAGLNDRKLLFFLS